MTKDLPVSESFDKDLDVDDRAEDIGEADLDGDGIPDELEAGDLDQLVDAVDPDDVTEPRNEDEDDEL